MGRKCFVPYCESGSLKCRDKHIALHRMPRDPVSLERWHEAIARTDRELTIHDGVCSKHFKKDDYIYTHIVNGVEHTYKTAKLKVAAIPSVFPPQPESLHGSVKRRRKVEAYTDKYWKKLQEKWRKADKECKFSKNYKNKEKISQKTKDETEPIKMETDTAIKEDQEFPERIVKEELIIKSEINMSEVALVTQKEENITNNNITNNKFEEEDVTTPNITKTKDSKQTVISNETNFICKQCPFVGKSLKSLAQHTVKRHNIGKNKPDKNLNNGQETKCFKCDYIGPTKCDLVKHLYEHTMMEVTSRKYENVGKNLGDESSNVLKCKNCQFDCVSKNDLVAHNMLEHGSFI